MSRDANVDNLAAVVVLAFKAVVQLEITRRENDKKIDLLFLEMRSMMSALVQYVSRLRLVKDFFS